MFAHVISTQLHTAMQALDIFVSLASNLVVCETLLTEQLGEHLVFHFYPRCPTLSSFEARFLVTFDGVYCLVVLFKLP